MGRLVEVADTKLYVEERGEPSAFPLLVFTAGPGSITQSSATIWTRWPRAAATGWCWSMSGRAAARTEPHPGGHGRWGGWLRM